MDEPSELTRFHLRKKSKMAVIMPKWSDLLDPLDELFYLMSFFI